MLYLRVAHLQEALLGANATARAGALAAIELHHSAHMPQPFLFVAVLTAASTLARRWGAAPALNPLNPPAHRQNLLASRWVSCCASWIVLGHSSLSCFCFSCRQRRRRRRKRQGCWAEPGPGHAAQACSDSARCRMNKGHQLLITLLVFP